MTKILHIETSTEICSVCISENGLPVYTKETHEGYQHSQSITMFVQACLKVSKSPMSAINAVAVSAGPGSYTGLRVGVSCAKALCYANDIPLISVSTLKSLAWATSQTIEGQTKDENILFCPMIDARRMEVYTALYDGQLNEKMETKSLIINSETFEEERKWSNHFILSGNGSAKTKTILGSNFMYSEIQCSASHLVTLAHAKFERNEFENLAHYVPNYLKQPNITVPKK